MSKPVFQISFRKVIVLYEGLLNIEADDIDDAIEKVNRVTDDEIEEDILMDMVTESTDGTPIIIIDYDSIEQVW